MPPLRRLLRNPAAAALIVAAALLLRVLVPAGYMPVAAVDGVVLALCPGAAPGPVAAMPHAGMDHAAMDHGDHAPTPATVEQGCAFADLALPAIGGADPVLLAQLLLFVLAAAFAPRPAPRPARPRRLRPPAHAPPLLA